MQTGTQELRITKAGNSKIKDSVLAGKLSKWWEMEQIEKEKLQPKSQWSGGSFDWGFYRKQEKKGLFTEMVRIPGNHWKDEKRIEKGHQGWTTTVRKTSLQSHLRRTTSSLKKESKRETCTNISLGRNHCVLWNCTGKLVANRIVEDMVKQTWSCQDCNK